MSFKDSKNWSKLVDWSRVKVYDLSQPLSHLAPPFVLYPPFEVKWIKTIHEHGVQAQYIQTSLHIGTHFDGPLHFYPAGPDIASIPLDRLVNEGVIIDISDEVGDYDIYTPDTVREKAREAGLEIKEGDILIIHTGYYKYAWYQPTADSLRYYIKHPGPDVRFAEWSAKMKFRWLGVDAVSQDHPLNTVIRRVRPDMVTEAEKKWGKKVEEMLPWPENYQVMHVKLFPIGITHAELMGGDLDKVLNKRCIIGCFPFKFQGGETAFARIVAFVSE